jgi:hypothetical protein
MTVCYTQSYAFIGAKRLGCVLGMLSSLEVEVLRPT